MKAGIEIEGFLNRENKRVRSYDYRVKRSWIVKRDASVVFYTLWQVLKPLAGEGNFKD